jgi:hypothetical protein
MGGGAPIAPESIETIRAELKQSYDKGAEGIPGILQVMRESFDAPHDPTSIAAVSQAVEYLHLLAKDGIRSKEELLVLLRAIRWQITIGDTYKTAETLRIITGLDVGYDAEFVRDYQTTDEDTRQQMIRRWEEAAVKWSERSAPAR